MMMITVSATLHHLLPSLTNDFRFSSFSVRLNRRCRRRRRHLTLLESLIIFLHSADMEKCSLYIFALLLGLRKFIYSREKLCHKLRDRLETLFLFYPPPGRLDYFEIYMKNKNCVNGDNKASFFFWEEAKIKESWKINSLNHRKQKKKKKLKKKRRSIDAKHHFACKCLSGFMNLKLKFKFFFFLKNKFQLTRTNQHTQTRANDSFFANLFS